MNNSGAKFANMSGKIQFIQFLVAMATEAGVVALYMRKPRTFTGLVTSMLASLPLLALNFTLKRFSTKGVLGKRQSPVDIDTDYVVTDPTVRGLSIKYNMDNNATVKNTGSSAKIHISTTCEIKGGPLKATYVLEQFHFHWGKEEGRGGEHTVDGKSFDAELHFVHYNKAKYGSFDAAVDKEDGLAVLGVLIKVGKEHRGISQLTSLFADITKSGSSGALTSPLDCSNLLPDKLDEYYTYPGSLTTPGYFESVHWIVFKEVMEISRQQMEAFRSLCDDNGDGIGDNYRETYPLCDRYIRSTF